MLETEPAFAQESAPPFEPGEEPLEKASAIFAAPAPAKPPEPSSYAPGPQARPSQPASPASIRNALEQVSDIVVALREALDDMEDVHEMLDQFERQKNADEREIEALRRSLRHLQRPRDGGGHPPRGRP